MVSSPESWRIPGQKYEETTFVEKGEGCDADCMFEVYLNYHDGMNGFKRDHVVGLQVVEKGPCCR